MDEQKSCYSFYNTTQPRNMHRQSFSMQIDFNKVFSKYLTRSILSFGVVSGIKTVPLYFKVLHDNAKP